MPEPDADRPVEASEQELLKSYLAERDIACPVCGYNLRACHSVKCPECSANLEIKIGSIDLRLGVWMTSLLALAIPFGFFVLIVAGGLAGMLKGELQNREDYILIVSSLGICIVLFFLMSIVIFKRKRFWKRQKRTQFLLCTLSIITGLSAIGGLILLGAIIN